MYIELIPTTTPKKKPSGSLGFGKFFTDHMFTMDYSVDVGWHNARIVPYGEVGLLPSSAVFHYGQESYEGMKVYKSVDGSCYMFRPYMNAKRVNVTNARMCIPEMPEETFVTAVKELIRIDSDWVPEAKDGFLYIRPFFIATDPCLGMAVSKTFLFIIIMSPSVAFYGDLKPISIWIEDTYVRAVRGGVGYAKTGGNYAASFLALTKAQQEGYDQVMWLDGINRRYIEEVGAMNIFLKVSNKIITPPLNGNILPGVTRDSVLTLCQDFGMTIEERLVSIDEIIRAGDSGTLEEVFGVGTAVILSPVNKLRYKDKEIKVTDGNVGPLSRKLYDTLIAIQRGEAIDKFEWRVSV